MMQRPVSLLVGRDRERAALLEILEPDGPLTVFVHGPGGIGKSALLEAFATEAQRGGARVVRLDSRAFEPTERGLLDALGAALGEPLDGIEDAIKHLSAGRPTVVVLDTYEVFRISDVWLRQVFAPALPDDVRLALAGREPPVSSWLGVRGGFDRFRSVRLEPLAAPAAVRLLTDMGFSTDEARAVNRVARGHPLALRVAGLALSEGPRRPIDDAAIPRVVDELISLYLAGADAQTRRILDAVSCLRRVTAPLVAAMMPDLAPDEVIERLRALPFVESASDGLRLHEEVQAALGARLQAFDPDGQRRHRAAAWRCLRREVRAATRPELWRYTADMLFLLQNPVIREAFFPTTQHLYVVERARADDVPGILEIIDRHEPPAAAAVLHTWLESLPEAVRAIRDRSGAVVGVSIVADGRRIPARLVREDPVVAAWREHARAYPPTGPQEVLFDRRCLSREEGEAPSDAQAVAWLDVKRIYMERRPNLARLYSVVADPTPYVDAMQTLGFAPLPRSIDLGRDYHLAVLDFGPGSVDGWLARLAAAEIGIEQEGVLDPGNRALVLDGARVPLTPLEYGVMDMLVRHAGTAVTRSVLLEHVWGSRYDGGSNVVDVVVRSLRKKLDRDAGWIEAVRGLGYRYAGPVF